MPRALVLYATTSGATAAVAAMIAQQIEGWQAEALDLGAVCSGLRTLPVEAPDLLVAGTPTYGKGDWHSAWERQREATAPLLAAARRVRLFALGDARGHRETFGGGLAVLRAHARACGAALGPPTEDLLLEYRRERRLVPVRLAGWLASGAPADRPAAAGA